MNWVEVSMDIRAQLGSHYEHKTTSLGTIDLFQAIGLTLTGCTDEVYLFIMGFSQPRLVRGMHQLRGLATRAGDTHRAGYL